MRRTPPFTRATVDDGVTVMGMVGVVLRVVTFTGLRLDKYCFQFQSYKLACPSIVKGAQCIAGL